MKRSLLVLFVFCSISIFAAQSNEVNIKVLYTSALIPRKFEERKKEYIKCLQQLTELGLITNTYVIESGPPIANPFFEDYCPNVFYSNTNNTKLRNKGVNEANSLINAFQHYFFDDEDVLVKLTGRYLFTEDKIFKFIKMHPEVDAVVSFRGETREGGFQTGCYALRGKYFKEWLAQLDLEKMERKYIDIERELTSFIDKMILRGAKVEEWGKIGITAYVDNNHYCFW